MDSPRCIIRPIREPEIPLLEDFLYEAIFVPEDIAASDRSIILRPELQVYIENFGMRGDDRCFVAESDGKIVGAVWVRIMNDYIPKSLKLYRYKVIALRVSPLHACT